MLGLHNVTGANMTNNSSGPPPFPFTLDLQVGLTTFAALIFITAIIGNSIVVYIVCSCNHMRNTTNILIANMAIADLWITLDIPYVVKWFYVMDTWFSGGFGVFMCKIFHSAQAGSVACSVFTLVCISLDRSFAILFPMKVILTRKIVKFMILGIWLATVAFTAPLFIMSTVVKGPDGICRCNEWEWERLHPHAQHLYITVYSICTYIVPLGLILVMYIFTGLRLWGRKIPGQRLSMRAHKKIHSSTRRATIMLITVVVVFAFCWFPFQIREIIKVYGDQNIDQKLPLRLILVLPWFGFANSAINPILYVVFSENYRREFRRTFTTTKRRRSSSISRATFRTRMSLTTGVPLQKLRNDSALPIDIVNDTKDVLGCRKDSRGSSNGSNKEPGVLPNSIDSDPVFSEAAEQENSLI